MYAIEYRAKEVNDNMKNGLISKSISVGKKAHNCWPGAQTISKEEPKKSETKKETK